MVRTVMWRSSKWYNNEFRIHPKQLEDEKKMIKKDNKKLQKLQKI